MHTYLQAPPTTNRPKVGVGVIVYKDPNHILLGKRINAHGHGCWAFPGGNLEFMEDIHPCAQREVLEETGLHISNIQNLAFTNDFFPDQNLHYITLFLKALAPNNPSPQLLEPHKCEQWQWFHKDNLPSPLFTPINNLLSIYPKILTPIN